MSCNDIHVQSTRESSILTHVCPPICLSRHGGVSQPGTGRQAGGVSQPGPAQWGGVTPASCTCAGRGGYPSQVQAGRGVPQPGPPWWGVLLQPHALMQAGGYPSQVQVGRGGTPARSSLMGGCYSSLVHSCRQGGIPARSRQAGEVPQPGPAWWGVGVLLQPGSVLTIVCT